MRYDFKCNKCKKIVEVSFPMSDYDKEKDKQFCPDCKEKMERVYEANVGVSLCTGMYGIDGKSGWNS